MKVKETISKVLMAFVLITIGFSVGKEMTLRKMAQNDNTDDEVVSAVSEDTEQVKDKVVVYYMHATFRCFTCNSIESMAKEVVENDFSDAMADGRLEWRTVNFQENMALGRRYGVGTSTLVVVKIQDGKEVDFKRLDEVWTKVNDPAAFKSYVDETIQAYLNGGSV